MQKITLVLLLASTWLLTSCAYDVSGYKPEPFVFEGKELSEDVWQCSNAYDTRLFVPKIIVTATVRAKPIGAIFVTGEKYHA